MVRRSKEAAEQTREAILLAGERLFIARGYLRVTLTDIAEAAGVTRGAVYWHFRDKKALLFALLDRTQLSLRAQFGMLRGESEDLREQTSLRLLCGCLLNERRTADDGDSRVRFDVSRYGFFLDVPETAELVSGLLTEINGALVEILRRRLASENRHPHFDPEAGAMFLQALVIGVATIAEMRTFTSVDYGLGMRVVALGLDTILGETSVPVLNQGC